MGTRGRVTEGAATVAQHMQAGEIGKICNLTHYLHFKKNDASSIR